jgi:hypothetical protein
MSNTPRDYELDTLVDNLHNITDRPIIVDKTGLTTPLASPTTPLTSTTATPVNQAPYMSLNEPVLTADILSLGNTNASALVDTKFGAISNTTVSTTSTTDPLTDLTQSLDQFMDRHDKAVDKYTNQVVEQVLPPYQQDEVKKSVKEPARSMTLQQLPETVVSRLGFFSLDKKIKEFKGITLFELIKTHTNTRFLQGGTKYCYQLDYKNLSLSYAEARDNYGDTIVPAYADSYAKQHMNSISGENTTLCYYTYSPSELQQFLSNNSSNKYTFLPITVFAIDSANGTRHDMLLIFDNNTKLFYWFDCKNRDDYLPIGRDLPKNAIDTLFITFSDMIKLGYNYEPSPSWQIQGTMHSYASLGDFDFLLATAWCYNMLLMLPYYDSPTGYLSVLDGLSESDRFHLVYTSMLNMLGASYHRYIPQTSQVDLTKEFIKPVYPGTETPQNSNETARQIQPVVVQPTQNVQMTKVKYPTLTSTAYSAAQQAAALDANGNTAAPIRTFSEVSIIVINDMKDNDDTKVYTHNDAQLAYTPPSPQRERENSGLRHRNTTTLEQVPVQSTSSSNPTEYQRLHSTSQIGKTNKNSDSCAVM